MTLPIPMFVCFAPQGALLVHVNGRIAGEAGPASKLSFPLGEGVHYLTFTPLGGNALPVTRRIAILGGMLQPELDAAASGDVDVLSWPGGIHELTIKPPRVPAYTPHARRVLDAVRFEDAYGVHRARLLDQGALALEIESDDGATLCALPQGSPSGGQLTVDIGAPTIVTASGPAEAGEYRTIVAREADGWRVWFDGAGDSVLPPEEGALRVLCDLRDTVGHGRMSEHVYREGGFQLARHAHIWYQGQPHWPHSAFATACAFVEAVCLREVEEARGYLTPAFGDACDLSMLIEEWRDVTGWADPRYQIGADPVQIGLVREVRPGRRVADIARFDVQSAREGTQGAYQIAGVQIVESAMG